LVAREEAVFYAGTQSLSSAITGSALTSKRREPNFYVEVENVSHLQQSRPNYMRSRGPLMKHPLDAMLRMLLAAALALAGCSSSYVAKPMPFKSPSAYPNATEAAGALVAA
jgi:hypothetical protein